MNLVDIIRTRLQNSEQALAERRLNIDRKRFLYQKLDHRLQLFLDQPSENQWLIMTGLRGMGKSTLLNQLYSNIRPNSARKFYFSFDELAEFPKASVSDFVKAVKQLKSIHPDDAFVLLLDEVHYLPDWQIGCKLLYDTVHPLFLVCTGSSALNLRHSSADVARRSTHIEAKPLSLIESYCLQNPQFFPNDQLQKLRLNIQQALFESSNSDDVYLSMLKLEPAINNYYQKIIKAITGSQLNIDDPLFQETVITIIKGYINTYLTLPFVLPYSSKQASLLGSDLSDFFKLDPETDYEIRSKILRTIRQSLVVDIYKFQTRIKGSLINRNSKIPVHLLPDLLLHLAYNDQTSLSATSRKMGINYTTFRKMIRILKETEIIYEISPTGKPTNRIPEHLNICLPLQHCAKLCSILTLINQTSKGHYWKMLYLCTSKDI